MKNPTEWSFAFFDLGAKQAARRVRLHRNLRDVGAAIHSQSVYCMPYSKYSFQQLKKLDKDMFVVRANVDEENIDELVQAYDSFISNLMVNISKKIDELEDAKAASVDMVSKRGYTKRFNKMGERLERLDNVAYLRQDPKCTDKVEEFKRRVAQIDTYEMGKLI
tara:strand:+ start:134 stop:625 length:492 start_codon:yes stop_codon:yes gene_type:complete